MTPRKDATVLARLLVSCLVFLAPFGVALITFLFLQQKAKNVRLNSTRCTKWQVKKNNECFLSVELQLKKLRFDHYLVFFFNTS